MAGRSQGRGDGMEQPSEEPSTPLEALCYGLPRAGRRAHLHTLLPVLRAVQLVVLVTVIVLAVLQERDLLQHRAAQALSAVLAGRVPALDGVGEMGRGQSCRATKLSWERAEAAGRSLSPGEPRL